DGYDEPGDAACGEGSDPEQCKAEHRLRDARLDNREDRQQHYPARDHGDHLRVGPSHGVAAVRLDADCDRDQQCTETHGEGDVAPPVDAASAALTVVTELAVCPQRSEHADWNIDPE